MNATDPLTAEEQDRLAAAAAAAALNAYAPYSRFRVGAAVLDADGRLHTGCNVENASYGLCLCAERNALSTALATGARRFRGIGVACIDAAPGLGAEGRSPCGACRQWMVELAPDAEVVIAGGDGRQPLSVWPVMALLPNAFRLT
jgi:cytidine deaminase